MRTIILAGGYGTRLAPITTERPKPLLPVAGRPIIDYLLDDPALPGRPIVSTNRRFADAFTRWQAEAGREVDLVIEESHCEREKLGTVGALAQVIERCAIADDILVIAGDNLFGFSMASFLAAYKGDPLIALCDVGSLSAVRQRYGVALIHDQRITGFQEKPREPQSTLASTACYIYPRRIQNHLRHFLALSNPGLDAPGYFNEWCLRERGEPIDAFIFDAYWFDVGDRDSYLRANKHFAGSDSWLGPGVTQHDSAIHDSVLLGSSHVERCDLTGCVVDTGCHLQDVCLTDCLVGQGSTLVGTESSPLPGTEPLTQKEGNLP